MTLNATAGVAGVAAESADEAEFTQLYEREYTRIARFLLRRGAGDAAPDLAAEVFVVAWRRQTEWRPLPEDRRLAWLYGVARRVLANSRRSEERKADLLGRITGADRNAPALAGAQQDHAGLTVEQLAVAAAFARLSDDDQELIRLVAWDGLTPAQAAEALGCRPGTLAMRLHRARTRLRKLMDASSPKG